MTITTGITSDSFGGNSHDDNPAYDLPVHVEHHKPGREVQNADPVKTAGKSNPLGPQRRPAPRPVNPPQGR